VGTASGVYAMAIIIVLILSAPAYRPDVPLAFAEATRKWTQRGLFIAQLLLIAAWCMCGYRFGREHPSCYISTLALGALAVIAPFMLFLMFSAANWIGRSAAR
jgi:hypothetical protein